jgi:hypothetical protein
VPREENLRYAGRYWKYNPSVRSEIVCLNTLLSCGGTLLALHGKYNTNPIESWLTFLQKDSCSNFKYLFGQHMKLACFF